MHKHVIPFFEGRKSEFFLGVGELAFAKKPCHIRTILGSCVGVTLHDRRLKIGGMSHFLLSEAPAGQTSTRYGDVAINALIRRFMEAGSRISDIEACVAGGALILDMNEVFFVGERNINLADEVLARNRIPVAQREVGGGKGRRMSLDTHSGLVHIEFIPEYDPDRNFAI